MGLSAGVRRFWLGVLTMQDFAKTVRVGAGQSGNVYCRIEFKTGKLSITGVEGPKANGDALGACGQIVMHDWELTSYAPHWNAEKVAQFRAIWDKWHLNDMQAGSLAQTAYLDANPVQYKYPECHYTKACEVLRAAGLNPDPNYIHNGKPYAYGSAWLRVDVPADALEFLKALPDTDKTPAWV